MLAKGEVVTESADHQDIGNAYPYLTTPLIGFYAWKLFNRYFRIIKRAGLPRRQSFPLI